jgi:hypothetical protein
VAGPSSGFALLALAGPLPGPGTPRPRLHPSPRPGTGGHAPPLGHPLRLAGAATGQAWQVPGALVTARCPGPGPAPTAAPTAAAVPESTGLPEEEGLARRLSEARSIRDMEAGNSIQQPERRQVASSAPDLCAQSAERQCLCLSHW